MMKTIPSGLNQMGGIREEVDEPVRCIHRVKTSVYVSVFVTDSLRNLEFPLTEIQITKAGNTYVHYFSATAASQKRIP